jgi:hypothetical protein
LSRAPRPRQAKSGQFTAEGSGSGKWWEKTVVSADYCHTAQRL